MKFSAPILLLAFGLVAAAAPNALAAPEEMVIESTPDANAAARDVTGKCNYGAYLQISSSVPGESPNNTLIPSGLFLMSRIRTISLCQ